MKLINLQKFRQKEVVDALRALLASAEAGEIEGVVYVIQTGSDDPRAGVVGSYRRHPAEALQATFLLERKLANTGAFASSR